MPISSFNFFKCLQTWHNWPRVKMGMSWHEFCNKPETWLIFSVTFSTSLQKGTRVCVCQQKRVLHRWCCGNLSPVLPFFDPVLHYWLAEAEAQEDAHLERYLECVFHWKKCNENWRTFRWCTLEKKCCLLHSKIFKGKCAMYCSESSLSFFLSWNLHFSLTGGSQGSMD